MSTRTRLSLAVRLFFVGSVVLLIIVLVGSYYSEASPPVPPETPYQVFTRSEGATLPESVAPQIPGEKHDVLASDLNTVINQANLSAQQRIDELRDSGFIVNDDRVQVQISVNPDLVDEVIAAAESLDVEITKTSQAKDLLQAWVSLSNLKALAEIEGVYSIQRPAYGYPADVDAAGSSMTEGAAVLNAPPWHAAGFTGNGVKVGIIDAGFIGFNSLLGSDLPASVTSKNFVDGETDPMVDGTTEHGTACAEIVHDTAPGAELYLAKVNTALDLQEAMLWLKDTHQVDIISSSLGWFNSTPGDGTGAIPDIVNQARTAGIFWATAAGNQRQQHYGATFSDTDMDTAHNFSPTFNNTCLGPLGGCWLLPSGVPITLFLRWDDWTAVTQDYELFLIRYEADWSNPTIFASSEDPQYGGPGQTPTEAIFAITSGPEAFYTIWVIDDSSTRDVDFELFSINIDLEYQVYARSSNDLGVAPDAMTVAALDVSSPYPQESYSSEGPTNGPGGTIGGGFIKPDIAAFANVSTESYGPGSFNGTSAATPHVAGAAALVQSAFPSYTPDQLQTYLETNAVDMGAAGFDTVFGHGRLLLADPPKLLFLPLIMR